MATTAATTAAIRGDDNHGVHGAITARSGIQFAEGDLAGLPTVSGDAASSSQQDAGEENLSSRIQGDEGETLHGLHPISCSIEYDSNKGDESEGGVRRKNITWKGIPSHAGDDMLFSGLIRKSNPKSRLFGSLEDGNFPSIRDSIHQRSRKQKTSFPVNINQKHFQRDLNELAFPFESIHQSCIKIRDVPIELKWNSYEIEKHKEGNSQNDVIPGAENKKKEEKVEPWRQRRWFRPPPKVQTVSGILGAHPLIETHGKDLKGGEPKVTRGMGSENHPAATPSVYPTPGQSRFIPPNPNTSKRWRNIAKFVGHLRRESSERSYATAVRATLAPTVVVKMSQWGRFGGGGGRGGRGTGRGWGDGRNPGRMTWERAEKKTPDKKEAVDDKQVKANTEESKWEQERECLKENLKHEVIEPWSQLAFGGWADCLQPCEFGLAL